MSEQGPYRDAPAKQPPPRFTVDVTVTIRDLQGMVREYLLARGWDPRKLPAKLEIDLDTDEIQVCYKLESEAP